ncbi:MAG: methylated-DNA--[protein]-cysteine S-methyltransferase [Ignavibacteria bacterium]|jgi:methylated-DNA-[protein]-cysteine S-methyltransferase|nr:methylated-DNA--[protein]-cysteine S-methyltransferase [Ignavibacteria bacterium]MDH7527763.1 methylated-DNA--[protein]-cysteine S-methyltransferase [Ignavibacteria bacterium]
MKDSIEIAYYKSPIGILKISADEKGITGIDFVKKEDKSIQDSSSKIIQDCIKQLDEYFQGRRKSFDLKLNPAGTEFQRRVWKELLKIPYGKTLSYGDISKRIKNKSAVRAVGQAIGKNPISIVIPCHRVIGSDGSLTGYASGLWRKKWLLKLEGVL